MTFVVLPDPTTEPTIDVPTAAALLGVGENTAYDSIKAGRFPVKTVRVGRRIRVLTADLLRVLQLAPSVDGESSLVEEPDPAALRPLRRRAS